jgi:hypothetical protein
MLTVAIAFYDGEARAQSSTAERAAAQGLFDEGRELLEQGRAAEACPKLEESQRLDPGIGTQFHLADCYERIGRIASAWTLFLEIASTTRSRGEHEREAVARERAARLANKVSRVSVVVPESSQVEGLSIERGGATVGRGQWGSGVPADPGPLVIRATAPGHAPWSQQVVVPDGGQSVTVNVPRLTEAHGDESQPPATGDVAGDEGSSEPGPSAWRVTALTLGGLGIVGLGVGGVFGLVSSSRKSDSQTHCDGAACDTTEGVEAYRGAQKAADIATVAVIAGGAALGAGIVLFFTEPERERSSAFIRARVVPTPMGGAFLAEGAF